MAFFGPPPPFVGATTSADGVSGLVPAPASGKSERLLNAKGEFVETMAIVKYKRDSASGLIFYRPAAGTGISATISPTANVRYFSMFAVPFDGVIDEVAIRIGTAPSSAYNFQIAIWKIADNGEPSDYIIGGTGSSGTTGTTDVVLSITPTNFKAGYYWASLTGQSPVGGTFISYNATAVGSFRWQMGTANLGSSTTGNFQYTCATSYDQTTHEAFVVSSGGASPIIAFRYQ